MANSIEEIERIENHHAWDNVIFEKKAILIH